MLGSLFGYKVIHGLAFSSQQLVSMMLLHLASDKKNSAVVLFEGQEKV